MSNALIVPNADGMIEIEGGQSLAEIKATLPKATEADIKKSLAALFTARKSAPNADAQTVLSVYAAAIKGCPDYALKAAVTAIIRGKAPNVSPVFVPSTDELCCEIERQIWLKIKIKPSEKTLKPSPTLPKTHFSNIWKDKTLEEKEAEIKKANKPAAPCPNCGESKRHFVPPSLGEEGFYTCKKGI